VAPVYMNSYLLLYTAIGNAQVLFKARSKPGAAVKTPSTPRTPPARTLHRRSGSIRRPRRPQRLARPTSFSPATTGPTTASNRTCASHARRMRAGRMRVACACIRARRDMMQTHLSTSASSPSADMRRNDRSAVCADLPRWRMYAREQTIGTPGPRRQTRTRLLDESSPLHWRAH
jgi:hypothetical protein